MLTLWLLAVFIQSILSLRVEPNLNVCLCPKGVNAELKQSPASSDVVRTQDTVADRQLALAGAHRIAVR